ncbi:MAG: flagellar protein FlaG [Lachnospiraceae bacterium]|nr:flagellar protein FlaG [Lachnospiraceae bacterium]
MEVKEINNNEYSIQSPIRRESLNTNAEDVSNDDLKVSKKTEDNLEKDEQTLTNQDYQNRMERLQVMLKDHNIEISYNEKVNRYAIKVLDSKSEEIIKEIPSEKMLDMFAKMLESVGLLVDERR